MNRHERRLWALATILAILALLAFLGYVRAGEGTASTWPGPGAATHDCRYPWKDCTPRRVTSLRTGVSIVVTPTMYCDCYVGRIGPAGETERLIDLDPAMVAALGLEPASLYAVDVELLPTGTLPNTATIETRR